MLTLRTRHPARVDLVPASASGSRPVVLATLEAPLDDDASRLAVESAVESGQPLLVVNAVESILAPCGLGLGYDYVTPPDVEESLRKPTSLAHGLGVVVERFCLRSPRPIEALLALVAERGSGLLVVGPDRTRISRRRYRKAARRIARDAPCLVWLASD